MPRFPTRPALALLGALLCLSACASTAIASVSPTATVTTPPASTAMAPLPSLKAETGWHVVLTLGNVFGTPVVVGGRFFVAKPYKLFFSCNGSGTLHVAYPAATETAPCREAPELNGTQPFPPPPGDGQVTITVSTEGAVQWEVIAETQD